MAKWSRLFLILPVIIVSASYSQTKTDSLIATLNFFPDTIRVQKLNVLAIQTVNRDITATRQLTDKALEVSLAIKYSSGEAESYRILCAILTRQGQFVQALDYCKKSEAIFAGKNNFNGLAEVYGNFGLAYIQQGQYPNALEAFNKSLKIWNQINRSDKSVLMVENIGMVHFRQEDYTGALQYFQDCYQRYKTANNEASASKILVNLGATYNRLKMPKQALASHLEALAFFEKTNSIAGMGIAYNNIGNVYIETKDYKKALEYFDKSLALKQKLNDKAGTAISLRNVAETYLYLDNLEKAKESIDRSLKIAEEVGAKEQIKDAYDILAKMYEKTKNYEQALAFEKKMAQAKDSLFSSEKTEQISRMRAIYETEKAEQQTELAKLETAQKDAAILVLNQENELKNTQRNFSIAVAVSLLALAILIGYLYQQKKKSNTLLAEKNTMIEKSLKERETLLKEIHHRVKNNLQIISSLLSLQTKTLSDSGAQDAISESRNRVKSMSLIHEQLYQEDMMSGVDMQDYIQRVMGSLTVSYGLDVEKVEVKIDAEKILLDVDSAIPLGLIINELASNSMKYAFPEHRPGSIIISLKEMMNELHLKIEDNGVGIDESKKTAHSFGLKMVNSLMRKLKAEMKIVSNAGTSVELIIRDFKKVTFEVS